MSNENEKMILVPLSPAVKERLERVADLHGRATAREAAFGIAEHVRRVEEKADFATANGASGTPRPTFASAEGGVRSAE